MADEKVWIEFIGTLGGIEEKYSPTKLDRALITLSFSVDAGSIKTLRTKRGMRPNLHVVVREVGDD